MSLGQTLSHMRDSILTCNTAEQVSPSGNVSNLCSGDAHLNLGQDAGYSY
jgi:hypothetical protein